MDVADRQGRLFGGGDDPGRPIRKLTIFFDGASRGNPGPAAIGAVLSEPSDNPSSESSGDVACELSESIGEATNNFAEYTALIRALEEAKKLGAEAVECFSDSELIVKQMNGTYRIHSESLRPLAQKAMSLRQEFAEFSLRHVPRSRNKRADRLASQALRTSA